MYVLTEIKNRLMYLSGYTQWFAFHKAVFDMRMMPYRSKEHSLFLRWYVLGKLRDSAWREP